MQPNQIFSHYTNESVQPQKSQESVLDTRRLEEEMTAMEAVRELLFGRRVAELQGRLQQMEDWCSAAFHSCDAAGVQRHQALESAMQLTEGRLTQRLATEQTERQAQADQFRQTTEDRIQALEKGVIGFRIEASRQFESLRQEMTALRQEVQGELKQIRQTMPTIDGLADLFRSTADRMRDAIGSSERESIPSHRRRQENPLELTLAS